MRQSEAKCQQTKACIHCKQEKSFQDFVKDKKAKDGVRNVCNACALARYKKDPNYRKKRNARVQVYRNTFRGGLYQRMQAAKKRAKDEGLAFNLDIDCLVDLFERQEGKCALSGLDLVVGQEHGWWDRVSLDKIIPELGYVKGNVQWLVQRINWMKGNLSNEEFLSYCKLIVDKGSETISKESTP